MLLSGKVQAQLHREVVAGTGGDHHERYPGLGGDGRDERLGTVAAGHPEQVGTGRQGLPGQYRDVDGTGAFEQHDLGAQPAGLGGQAEPFHLPPAGPRVHDEERPPRRCRLDRHGAGG